MTYVDAKSIRTRMSELPRQKRIKTENGRGHVADYLIRDGITDLTDIGLTDFNNSGPERPDEERC